ncbi:MAG: hypothetical protein AAGH40_12175 [Verrucomicrobiota bacterium]
MEQLKEALTSGSFLAWAIIIVLIVLFFKLLKSAGKGLMIFLVMVGLSIVLYKFFPGMVQPLVDFVNGSWMN